MDNASRQWPPLSSLTRELERNLPFEEVRALDNAGFGTLRVPADTDEEAQARLEEYRPYFDTESALAESEAGQTVRERITGGGPWLADDHQGASYRVG